MKIRYFVTSEGKVLKFRDSVYPKKKKEVEEHSGLYIKYGKIKVYLQPKFKIDEIDISHLFKRKAK